METKEYGQTLMIPGEETALKRLAEVVPCTQPPPGHPNPGEPWPSSQLVIVLYHGTDSGQSIVGSLLSGSQSSFQDESWWAYVMGHDLKTWSTASDTI